MTKIYQKKKKIVQHAIRITEYLYLYSLHGTYESSLQCNFDLYKRLSVGQAFKQVLFNRNRPLVQVKHKLGEESQVTQGSIHVVHAPL